MRNFRNLPARGRDRRPDREAGMAVVVVVFLGLALVMLTAVVSMRTLRQTDDTRSDAQWEQALQAAEAGLDHGLALVNADSGFSTGETMPSTFSGPEALREWVVAAADARAAAGVAITSDGQYVIVRPTNTTAIYAVGFVPDREATGRRVRAVRAQLGSAELVGGWKARYAVLTGGPIQFIGNPLILSGSAVGVHSNGYLEVGGSTFVDGCLSASGGAKVTGSVVEDPSCQPPGIQASVQIPVIDPRQLWHTSTYDLCPDGKVRAGPAHPTSGWSAGSAPCTGVVVAWSPATVTFRGWKYLGPSASLGARWQQTSGTPYDGVYYVHQGSVDLASNTGSTTTPWRVTLLVAGSGVCPAITGGDVSISGSPVMRPYPGTSSLLVAAGRDFDVSGNPDMSGILAAHEQVESTGNTNIHEGTFLAEDACDSANDSVSTNYIAGNTTLNNTGPLSSPFGGTIVQPVVVAWDEL
jgi:hypothetical protein